MTLDSQVYALSFLGDGQVLIPVEEETQVAIRPPVFVSSIFSSKQPEPLPWSVYDLAEAYKARPPIAYVVDGIIEAGSLSIFYGSPGSLKSMILADMAVCVAGGVPWLPALPGDDDHSIATLQGPTLWVDFDNGKRRTDERFDALARSRRLPVDTPCNYVAIPTPWLDMSSRDMAYQLAELIYKHNALLTVVDNLSVTAGGVDENSPKMAPVMSNYRWVVEQTGTALVLIHHQSKGRAENGQRKGDKLRGHSSIEASLDLGVHVDRNESSPDIMLEGTKFRGATFDPFCGRFIYNHRSGTKELDLAEFRYVLAGQEHDIEQCILEIVASNQPINQTSLVEVALEALKAKNLPANDKKTRGVVKRLVDKNKLRVDVGDKNAHFYSIANA